MKKILTVLISIILAMSMFVTAYAEETYEITDIDFTVYIPDGLYYVSKDTDADDPFYQHFNLDKTTIDETFESNTIAKLIIMPADASYEIDISSSYTDDAADISEYSDAQILEELENFSTENVIGQSIEVETASVYSTDNEKFVRCEGTCDSRNAIFYYTIVNHNTVCFTFCSLTDGSEDLSKYEDVLKEIIDNSCFDESTHEDSSKEAKVNTAKRVAKGVTKKATEKSIALIIMLVFGGVAIGICLLIDAVRYKSGRRNHSLIALVARKKQGNNTQNGYNQPVNNGINYPVNYPGNYTGYDGNNAFRSQPNQPVQPYTDEGVNTEGPLNNNVQNTYIDFNKYMTGQLVVLYCRYNNEQYSVDCKSEA